MPKAKPFVHPYVPNTAPRTRDAMLQAVGASTVEDLYAAVPTALRMRKPLDLPRPLTSESALRRHVEAILARNRTCQEFLNFQGAGCYQHEVPAVCDEINSRGEFLTAYAGEPYDDHGRFQALFEYASLMGELLEMDVVNVPTYDGLQAAATALRMACRITGRREVLVSRAIAPDKLSKIRDYCAPRIRVGTVPFDPVTGETDMGSLEGALSDRVAAVYLDNPSYLGILESRAPEVVERAHARGALAVVGVDPISLGVVAPPSAYGADIAVGDIQPLGIHMAYGGGHGGFIATRDEPRFVMEYPSRLFGIVPTAVEGEYGFGDVAYERTSFAKREGGKEFVGTASALWGITAGVYLALLGPRGIREIGEGILQRSHYAAKRLGRIRGVRSPALRGAFFQEFVVDLRGTGKRAATIRRALLRRGIFAGVPLGRSFPEFRDRVLFCVSEVHTKADIDRLANALQEEVP